MEKPIMIAASEVSKFFPGLHYKTLANMRSQGKGPRYYKVGRKVFYRIADLEAWLTQNPILTADYRKED